MALTEAARVKLAEMSRQWTAYCSGWDTANIKQRSPTGIWVQRLPNSVARTPAMKLRILPGLNLSAGHRFFPSAQNRKELHHDWEVVGHS
jgi:hypothetical protein